jgi:hypothetical protein
LEHHVNRYVVSLIALPAFWFVAVFAVDAALEGATRPDHPADRLECGRHLTDRPDDPLPLVESVRVVLITDEEWRDTLRGPQPSGARHVLLDAASLFRGVSIHFLAVRIVDWDSPDDADTVRGVWAVARESIPLAGADVAVVLTAQARTTSQDGYAEVGGRYVAVAHHPEHPGRDALVLAHEVSHLFGAHHACDVPGRRGLMTPRGFDGDLICPCTRRILELNADRFHEVSDEPPG